MSGGVSGVTASWGASSGAWGVLVHGGAGDVAAERVDRHVQGCRAAAVAAAQVLLGGGSALDAVERAVIALEDDPLFNAGTGACLNEEGLIELDASIMEGARLRAGAVGALPPFPNPVAIARAALEDGRHVFHAAEGAARFALERGFVRSTSEAMTTDFARARWTALRAARAEDTTGDGQGKRTGGSGASGGTVGAVARDARGTVAAATSTGGRVYKRVGRVGDSPVLGAGTYADDDAGACSATGDGEAILRVCLARGAIDLLRARIPPEEASRAILRAMNQRVGATAAGVILVDRFGQLGFARTTPAMTWAAAGEKLEPVAGA